MVTDSDIEVEADPPGRERRAPLVIAHRGASARWAENTLEAFAGAAALGADWVELDVWRSADGVLLVHHDAHLVDGRFIRDIDADSRPAGVPTLDDALDTCAVHDLGVNVEIKSDPRVEADFDPAYRAAVLVADRLVVDGPRADGSRRYLVTSFDLVCIERVRAHRPELATGHLVGNVKDPARVTARAARAGHGAVNPWDAFVDETFMEHARRAGLAVHPWTVDDPDRMRTLVELGVDGIITNTPDVLRALLDRG
jgi:glycerophosphoryl diester phosphodiesterase